MGWHDLDPRWAEPGPQVLAALRERLGPASDLDPACTPGNDRGQIVDHEGHVRVRAHMLVLPRLSHTVAADGNGPGCGIEAETGGNDVGVALSVDGGQPAQSLLPQVFLFGLCEVATSQHGATLLQNGCAVASCG